MIEYVGVTQVQGLWGRELLRVYHSVPIRSHCHNVSPWAAATLACFLNEAERRESAMAIGSLK